MRTNGKCNIQHACSTGQSDTLPPPEPNIPKDPEYEKYQHFIDVLVEVLPAPQQQLLWPLNNPEKRILQK